MASGITSDSETIEYQDDLLCYYNMALPDKKISEMNDYERALKLEHLKIIKQREAKETK